MLGAMTHYENIVNASRDFITLVNRDYVYIFANDAYCKEIGRTREAIIGKHIWDIWGSERYEKRVKTHIDSALAGSESHDIDRFVFGEGYKYIHVAYFPYYEDDKITHVMIYSHDISVIKGLESRLIDYEFKDITTGLFNRKSFDIVMDMELEKAKRSNSDKMRVVMFLNLDNFNEINLQYGHDIGDLILESTGIRIKDTLRASDHVFRFEGKEFAAILTTLANITDVATVAEKVWSTVSLPYPNKDSTISLESHIGLSVYPDDGTTSQELVRNALSALNEAKRRGERFTVFNRDLHERSLGKIRLKANIRKALIDEQFELRFQPVVTADGRIAGAEALIRWHHPQLGWIPPGQFIPIAEEAGDILMVGRWVMYRVCSCLQQLSEVLGDRYISVNLSTREFAVENLVDDIADILKASGWSKISAIKLEITESYGMADMKDTIAKMNRFHEMGFDLFIDDFGAGFSSLSYLKQLPAQTIKIDKIFVDDIVGNPSELDFLIGMVHMIESKRKNVIIEGVATPEQFALLKSIPGIKYQGYHFSEPVTADELYFMMRDEACLPLAVPASAHSNG
jgi:diguanylate cyclase (GGDEF)-like protein/PAS domain S-box-containing protein